MCAHVCTLACVCAHTHFGSSLQQKSKVLVNERRSSGVQGWGGVCWLLRRRRGLHLNVSVEGGHPVPCRLSYVNGSYCSIWIPSFLRLRLFLGSRLSPPASAESSAGAQCTWRQKQLQWGAESDAHLFLILLPNSVTMWADRPVPLLLSLDYSLATLLQDERD